MFRIETDAQRPGRANATTGELRPFNDDHLKKEIIPQHTKLTKHLSALQKSRMELQKLSRFPDADLVRALNDKQEDDVLVLVEEQPRAAHIG